MALETAIIQEALTQKFGQSVQNFEMQRDIFSFNANSESIHDVIQFLKDNQNFNFLTDLCGVHYPDNDENYQFCVVYHMHNWVDNVRIRIKTYLNGNNPAVNTITDLFLTANWMERETFDFYGITFAGHPQLKRILNMEEMVSYPMRKEFPMEDSGRTDKDDRFFGRTAQN